MAYMMTRQEAAQFLSVGVTTLDKAMKRKENPLPYMRMGKRILISKEELEKWILTEIDRQKRKGDE